MRPDITKRFENTFPHVLQDFDAYKQKFETTFPESPTVQKLDSPGLYRNFDRMIFDSRPNHKYVNSDWKSIGFFGFHVFLCFMYFCDTCIVFVTA